MGTYDLHINCFWAQRIEGFYAILANGLKFPKYFSGKLDSLSECLSDLTWLEESQINIYFYEEPFFLKGEAPGLRSAVKQTIEEAVEELLQLEEEEGEMLKKLSIYWK
ncbi:MAG: barstar family protein [Lewinellaceae bacterium]|nr:barstar family protein [Lewinellaceae bacterium]